MSQAASTSARRARRLPARVRPLRRIIPPVEARLGQDPGKTSAVLAYRTVAHRRFPLQRSRRRETKRHASPGRLPRLAPRTTPARLRRLEKQLALIGVSMGAGEEVAAHAVVGFCVPDNRHRRAGRRQPQLTPPARVAGSFVVPSWPLSAFGPNTSFNTQRLESVHTERYHRRTQLVATGPAYFTALLSVIQSRMSTTQAACRDSPSSLICHYDRIRDEAGSAAGAQDFLLFPPVPERQQDQIAPGPPSRRRRQISGWQSVQRLRS